MSQVPRAANVGPRSSALERVEALLFRSGVRFDPVDPSTWVVQLDNQRRSRVVVKVEEPIVLFSVPLGSLDTIADASPSERERLFRTLLELNADLLHSAYAIEGARVVLSGALQTESLDANEFQAVLDDLTMALDTHLEKLSDWQLSSQSPGTEMDTKPTTET